MTSIPTLMGSGLSGAAAEAITTGTKGVGLTAAGTTAADAFQLTADSNLVTTCASGAGVKLPDVGGEVTVYNGVSGNACLVYPPTGQQLNNLTATSGTISIGASKGATFKRLSATHWGCTSD